MRQLEFSIPTKDGEFDVDAQKVIAVRFKAMAQKKAEIESSKQRLDDILTRYLA